MLCPDPPRFGRRKPGLSIRLKLALSYAAFLIVAGLAIFAVGFLLLRFVPDGTIVQPQWSPNRSDLLEVFVRYASIALAGLALIGLIGGWVMAGWMLSRVHRITDAAATARAGSLSHRIALPGRRDELTDLADTFDGLLEGVERRLEEERRFAANASHELRTPHSIIRTVVEVAQADPAGRDVDTLLARIGETNDRAIATTEALLALARAERAGAMAAAPVDLAAVAAEVWEEGMPLASHRALEVTRRIDDVEVTGDRALLGTLLGNLVRNAVVHNIDGGWVRFMVRAESDAALIEVENTGAPIAPEVAATLTEPFTRAAGRARSVDGPAGGSGLGLAIAASIVRAHRGSLTVSARPEGGLLVRVRLPRAPRPPR